LSCSRIARSSVDCLVSITLLFLLCAVRRSLQVGYGFCVVYAVPSWFS
jgi:hypothetical protein